VNITFASRGQFFKPLCFMHCVPVLHSVSSWYSDVKDSTCPSATCSSHQWLVVMAQKNV